MTTTLVLAGCWTVPGWHSGRSVEAAKPVAAAEAKTDTALEQSEILRKQNQAKTRANVQAAREANAKQPAGANTTVAEGELAAADARMKDTPASPEELAAAAERRMLVEAGKADEARHAYEQARGEAAANADKAVAADEQAKAARQHEKEEHEAYEKRIKEDADATAAAFKAQREGVLHEQAKWLSIAAAGCLAIFLLGAGFGQLAGLKIVWPFSIYAILLFGLAQIVAQPWFIWAVGGVVVVGGIVTGAWVRRHYLQGDLLQAAKDKAAKLASVAKPTVEVLDKAYENAEPSVKAWLDEHVFNVLSGKMDAAAKAAVHEVRAEA